MYKALVIPVEGPVYAIQLDDDGPSLDVLKEAVGGYIEAVPIPSFIRMSHRATAYVNEEGKFDPDPNMRATDFMVPGVGIQYGDFISGPMVLAGFDPETGATATLPQAIVDRVLLIEDEAA